MSRINDSITLIDIANAEPLVEEVSVGLDDTDFQEDLLKQSAILHQLQIIGEAVGRLSLEFQAAHPEMPGKK